MHKWTSRYLEVAKLISTWSKDPSTKIGAIVVGSDGQIIANGYNGFPRRITDSYGRFSDRTLKLNYTIHAEMNCIYNASLTGISVKGATLYLYGLPCCHECAKGIIQSGINKVNAMYSKDKDISSWADSCDLARRMFLESDVEYQTFSSEWK